MQSFDTHSAVKSLIGVGVKIKTAEMIIKNINDSRNFDMSNFVTKDKFLSMQTEMQTRLNKKISAVVSDTTVMKNDFEWIKENMATKAELAEVRTEIAEIKAELKSDIAGIKTELAEVKSEFRVALANTKAEITKEISNNTKWIIGLMIAQTTILVGLAKFFLHL